MRAWCPRCDAVRPGETACPVCGTSLATLDDTAPGNAQPDLPPPPEVAPAPAQRPPRLRLALAAATLVLAALAFVAGRSIARSAAPAAAAAATSTTVPEPGADRRTLGWSARGGQVAITAVEARRQTTERRETVAAITFRVQGLPAGQGVLALRGLQLLDSGGGVFASVDHREIGKEGGAPVTPVDGDPGAYRLVTGPAPRLSSLARIELTGLLVVKPRGHTVTIDTSAPWPEAPPLKAVDPGPGGAVLLDFGVDPVRGIPLQLQVTSAFVGGGRALVVIDASAGYGGVPAEFLPLGAELRAGGRVLCSHSSLLGEDASQQNVEGIVLSCPTRPVPRLTVAVGVGAASLSFEAALTP
jgi:hypothetical protein